MTSPTRDTIETLIRILAAAEGLDVDLVLRQCQQESAFKIDAVNKKSGACGLFQLMPNTASWLQVNPRRWHENVFGGIKYDAKLLNGYSGDYAKMLAAYNWGSGNLSKCLLAHGDAWRDYLPDETKQYLDIILPKS